MGGKGKRRREKNFLAAHGHPARLPPPPDASKHDALPSKLRMLISFSSPSPIDSAKGIEADQESNGKAGSNAQKRVRVDNETKSDVNLTEDVEAEVGNEGGDDDAMQKDGDEKRKRKRKRKQVKDLRFVEELEALHGGSKRKERKKKYWEAKKNKRKKGKAEETVQDFPKHEKIRFGEVVEAPPKLVVVPKAPKSAQSASKERVRLQTIEAYRSRKGWTSRPGLQFPPVTT